MDSSRGVVALGLLLGCLISAADGLAMRRSELIANTSLPPELADVSAELPANYKTFEEVLPKVHTRLQAYRSEWATSHKREPLLLSIVTPYFNQPEDLHSMLDRYQKLPETMRRSSELIVVDDGSGVKPLSDKGVYDVAMEQCRGLELLCTFIVREEDIGFDHGGPLNTGVAYSSGRFLGFFDMDHWFETEDAEALWATVLEEAKVPEPFMKVLRIPQQHRMVDLLDENRKPYGNKTWWGIYMSGSPNTMVISNSVFTTLGGYNEIMAGHYGNDDIVFMKCIASYHGVLHLTRSNSLTSHFHATYDSDHDSDKGFSKDTSHNERLMKILGSRRPKQFCSWKRWAWVKHHMIASTDRLLE